MAIYESNFGGTSSGFQIGHNSGNIYVNPGSSSPQPAKQVYNLPEDRLSRYFTGRSNDLGRLIDIFQDSETKGPARCIIHGMPGIGKSQLAIKFATLAKSRCSFIFWVSASTIDKINTGFSHIYTLVTGNDGDQDTLVVKAQKWLETNSNWLLVVDNVNYDTAQHLRDLLPQADCDGNILITTRFADLAEDLAYTRGEQHSTVDLQVLTTADATDLFLAASNLNRGSGPRITTPESRAAEQLVSTLGNLPLAIDHAAAFAKTSGNTPQEILRTQNSESGVHMYEWEHTLSKHEARSVAALFEPILQQISKTAPVAYDLLQVLAFLDPESLSMDMIEKGLNDYRYWKTTRSRHILWRKYYYKIEIPYKWHPKEIRTLQPVIESEEDKVQERVSRLRTAFKSRSVLVQNLQVLQQSSLLHTKNGEMKVFWMHDLVQAFLRHRSPSSAQHLALCIVTTACMENGDSSDLKLWMRAETYLSHIKSIMEQLQQAGISSLRVLLAQEALSRYLTCVGRNREAEKLNEERLAIATRMLGEQHFETLNILYHLAWICFDISRTEEAIEYGERYMKVVSGALKGNHPDIFWVRSLLVRAYSKTDRYRDAEALVKELIRENFRLGARHDLEIPDAMTSLSACFYDRGQYYKAELVQRQICRWHEKLYGDDHLQTIYSTHYLALTVWARDYRRSAIELMQHALSLHIKFAGINEPYTKDMMRKLSSWQSEVEYSSSRDLPKDQNDLDGLSDYELHNKVVSFLTDFLQLSKPEVEDGLGHIESKCRSKQDKRRIMEANDIPTGSG